MPYRVVAKVQEDAAALEACCIGTESMVGAPAKWIGPRPRAGAPAPEVPGVPAKGRAAVVIASSPEHLATAPIQRRRSGATSTGVQERKT